MATLKKRTISSGIATNVVARTTTEESLRVEFGNANSQQQAEIADTDNNTDQSSATTDLIQDRPRFPTDLFD